MTKTTTPCKSPVPLDPLGATILALLPLVEADRAEHIVHGPTEQWLDTLAVAYARQCLERQLAPPVRR